MDLQTVMWVYPWDLHDEGIEVVLDNIQNRAGVNDVAVALCYHSGAFLLPHNPVRKVYYPQPSIYFEPEANRYQGLKIQPVVNPLASSDLLDRLARETSKRDMRPKAWVVALHNSGLGKNYPECTQVTAFGDHLTPQLCPSNPDVIAYCRALFGDLYALEFDAIAAESLEFMSLAHGHHHEVHGIRFTPLMAWFAGMCFCNACKDEARNAGIDFERVRGFVRGELEAFFAGNEDAGRAGIRWPEIKQLADAELGAYHRLRVEVVTRLFQEIVSERPAGLETRLEVIDFGPLWRLGVDGSAWESGFDLLTCAPYYDALYPCPYFSDPALIPDKLDEYRNSAPGEMPILPIVRAIPPQVGNENELQEFLTACQPDKVAGFGFYNYGFMRLTTLDWIKTALSRLSRSKFCGQF